MGPLLQPSQVPLDGFPSFQCVDCTTQLGVIRKLAEGALDAIVCVIDKDVEEHSSQDRPLENTICDWPPPGHRVTDHNPLAATIQMFLYPLSSPAFKSISLQFRVKDVV